MEKRRVKLWLILGIVLLVIVIAGVIFWESHYGNRQLFDNRFRFNHGIIRLPNGEVVEGTVSSWLDFDDSDVVQVTMNGTTYLTHYSNVCLISN